MAVPAPSAEVVRRNRAKVLQRVAQIREAKAKPVSRRIWLVSLRRVAVTLVVLAALFVSGTNLVRAASTTLPGDNLSPVKRTWEDVLTLFTFNLQEREALEIEHENERLHELRELFAEGRFEEVEFAGLVTSQNGVIWVVSPGIVVLVSDQTELRDGSIVVGSAVRVKGKIQGDGVIAAEQVRLLPPDAKLPDLDDEHDGRQENQEGNPRHGDDKPRNEETPESSNSGSGSDNSGSGSDNENDSSGNDNENSGSGNDGGGDDNNDNGGGKDSGGNDNENGGSSNDGGGDDNSNHGGDNSDDSGDGDNSGSGGGGGDD
jgi:hypothetical protein